MRPIQLVILFVAFAAAGSAGMLAMNIARTPANAAAKVEPAFDVEEVLVASSTVNIGTSVSADILSWRLWPAEGVGEGFITRRQRPDAVTELIGTMVRGPLFPGEPIREAKLVRSERGFMSTVLPKGMRALAVKVNAASTAGGFILPNDRVDVILIRTDANNRTVQSETILTNIKILAIDQTIEGDGTEQKPVMVANDTATLELNPSQAELITQAQQMGTIALALRSIEDTVSEAAPAPKPSAVSLLKFGISSRVSSRETQ